MPIRYASKIVMFLLIGALFFALPVRAEGAKTDEQRCVESGGKWAGTEEGRGRLTGCVTATHDAGKPCHDTRECESVCLSDASSSAGGKCYGFSQYRGCHILQFEAGGALSFGAGKVKEMCVD